MPSAGLPGEGQGGKVKMRNRNYIVSPRKDFINCYEVEGAFCGSNGQCIKYECQEWIGHDACYPELVRDERTGFAICPRCGGSYGKDAMTGVEYENTILQLG